MNLAEYKVFNDGCNKMNLEQYINSNYSGCKASFARVMGVTPQQVTKWINDEWIVLGGILYSPRREVPER